MAMLEMNAKQEYWRLIAVVDQEIERLKALHGSVLQCRQGCAGCCQELTLLPLEAAIIRDAFAALDPGAQKRIRAQAKSPAPDCPFLLAALCGVYSHRPLICRTHGLPAAYIDAEQEAVVVSACPLNFPEEHEFSRGELLFMDRLNARLAALNAGFTGRRGISATMRLTMREILFPATAKAKTGK